MIKTIVFAIALTLNLTFPALSMQLPALVPAGCGNASNNGLALQSENDAIAASNAANLPLAKDYFLQSIEVRTDCVKGTDGVTRQWNQLSLAGDYMWMASVEHASQLRYGYGDFAGQYNALVYTAHQTAGQVLKGEPLTEKAMSDAQYIFDSTAKAHKGKVNLDYFRTVDVDALQKP